MITGALVYDGGVGDAVGGGFVLLVGDVDELGAGRAAKVREREELIVINFVSDVFAIE
jgi:hypothetical protein